MFKNYAILRFCAKSVLNVITFNTINTSNTIREVFFKNTLYETKDIPDLNKRILEDKKRCSSRTPSTIRESELEHQFSNTLSKLYHRDRGIYMKIDENIYKRIKKEVEDDLRNYPYYLISIETPGLGAAIRPDIIINKNISPSDPVGKSIVESEYKRALVNVVGYVYDTLDKQSKRIIESGYFRDDISVKEIIKELKINKNKYYQLKEKAIYKFAIGIGYC